MGPEPFRKAGEGLPVLRVGPDASVAETLFEFGFGRSTATPDDPVCDTGLEHLGGSLPRECWQVDASIKCGRQGLVQWCQAGDLLFLASIRDDDGHVDPAPLTEQTYLDVMSVAADRGCPRLLRAWNYLPDINRGEGDQERYRRFCLGRAAALDASGVSESELCAGTAIGSDEPHFRVFVLAGARPGINVENPRQLSAFRYPPIYGPRSPSFARATALPQPDGTMLLMVSGTASVVGHETLHDGDLEGQLDEIVANLNALLAESVLRLGRPGLRQFGPQSLLRVYTRQASAWPQVAEHLTRAWPESALVGLRGDICRADLLVEIEAVTVG